MPRHSPYALCSLTFRFFQTFGSFSVLFLKNFPFKIGSSFILLPSSLCILYIFQCAMKVQFSTFDGGGEESRTPDLLLARQAL